MIEKELSYSVETPRPYEKGLEIIGVSNEKINEYGEVIHYLYSNYERATKQEITRNPLTMLKGAIFAIGTEELNNLEWKEHCASSLREIFHVWKSSGSFKSAVADHLKERALTAEEKDELMKLWLLYDYFSGVDHHEASGIMNALKSYLGDQTLKLEDCYANERFISVVKDFFHNDLRALINIHEST